MSLFQRIRTNTSASVHSARIPTLDKPDKNPTNSNQVDEIDTENPVSKIFATEG
jgi:hypothetical protein